MTQRHLKRAVARATGETLATVRRRGFGPAAVAAPKPPEPRPRPKGGRRGPTR